MAQRKKNVAYVLNQSTPSFRNRLFMASLKNLGHEPVVISRDVTDAKKGSIRKSEKSGLTVYTISTSEGRGSDSEYRQLLRKVLGTLEKSLSAVYLTSTRSLRLFAFSGKRPFSLAYDATETSYREINIRPASLNALAARVAKAVERKLIRMAGVDTVTLSGSRASEIGLFRKACDNSSVVQTVPSLAQGATEQDRLEVRKKIGNRRVVASLGGLSGIEEINYALEVAENVVDAYGDVLFLFFGRINADSRTLKKLVSDSNLEGRVHFPGEVPYRKMMSYLENSHVGLALDSASGSGATTGERSMRMFSYMQAGIPVVGPAFCSGAAVARETGCGLFVDTSSPVEVAGSVAYLLTHPEKAQEHGQRGHKAFKGRYNWDVERQNLVSLFAKA